MDTIDIKRAKIEEITANGRAETMRRKVWHQLRAMGLATTEQVAAQMRLSVLSVRPRMTELLHLGLARLTGKIHANGVYEVIEADVALRSLEEPLSGGEQMNLGI